MLKKLIRVVVVTAICASLLGAEVKWKYVPVESTVGYYGWQKIKWDESRKLFIDSSFAGIRDNWMWRTPEPKRSQMFAEMDKPIEWPAKKKYEVNFKLKVFRKPQTYYLSVTLIGGLYTTQKKHRVVLINVEGNEDMPPSVRCHPHLGLLSIGTVARCLGHEVLLWDELVQGQCNLEALVRPGDIVGFSLVITGVERGVTLARQAKQLSAACVVAGNDSAIFRCNQLLSLPGAPFDGIFTSNSTDSWQQFLEEFNGNNIHNLSIPELKTRPGTVQHSNARGQMVIELQGRKAKRAARELDLQDGFIIPDFTLFPDAYWKLCWNRAQQVYGHQHRMPVRNSTVLLAQGCTRTRGVDVCNYCSIFGVGDIRIPSQEYLGRLLQAYKCFGITKYYNTTDSAFEMAPLLSALEKLNVAFPAMTIYARAQGAATNPKLLERWLKLVSELELNIGMDSGDDTMLLNGIGKSSVVGGGSRLAENQQAVYNILNAGANLHFSVIFGSPGETRESCERTLDFICWALAVLGPQINMVESDLFWLNHGAPAAKVFSSYEYACELAAKAGKSITRQQWWKYFGSQQNTLVVPWATEKAWYDFFTYLSLEEAQEFNERVLRLMASHEGAIGGRAFFPRDEKEV